MKAADLSFSAILLAISGYLYYLTLDFPKGLHSQMQGPAFWPQLIIIGLLIGSSLLIISALLGHSSGERFAISIPGSFIGPLAAIVFVIAMPRSGYLSAAALTLFGLLVWRRVGLVQAAALTLVITGGSYLLFAKALGVAFPTGLLF